MYEEDITGQFCAKLNHYLISQPRTQAFSRYPSDQRRLGTERDRTTRNEAVNWCLLKNCSVRDAKKISKKLHQVIIILASMA